MTESRTEHVGTLDYHSPPPENAPGRLPRDRFDAIEILVLLFVAFMLIVPLMCLVLLR